MKKTVSIHLNGLIFNIDEDAYMVLSSYIDELKAYFGSKEEGIEIINDIEARIAELFSEKIKPSKQVISLHDVEEVISILGRVEEICGEAGEKRESGFQDKEQRSKRKLYRDQELRILGGVCSGLSAYTGINLLAIRIIFMVLFLFSAGFMTLVYLVLWLIIPKARTVAERLEMKGKDINISNIENTIKEEYQEVKSRFREMKRGNNFGNKLENAGKGFVQGLNAFFKVFGKLIGASFIALGVFLTFILAFGLFASSSEFFIFEIAGANMLPVPYVLKLFAGTTTAYVFLVALAVVVFVPLLSLIYSGVSILFNLKSMRALNFSLLVLWISGLAMLIAVSVSISTRFISNGEITQKSHITHHPQSTLYLSMNHSMPFDNNLEQISIDEFHLIRNENKLTAFGTPELIIQQSPDSSLYYEIQRVARGSNKTDASKNASQIRYNYSINDSAIVFDRYFKLPDSFSIRFQGMNIRLMVPEGKLMYIDKSVFEIITDHSNNQVNKTENESGYYMMKNEKLLPVVKE